MGYNIYIHIHITTMEWKGTGRRNFSRTGFVWLLAFGFWLLVRLGSVGMVMVGRGRIYIGGKGREGKGREGKGREGKGSGF